MTYALTFKAITWYKDSHSLFDYQSNKISQANYEIVLPEKHVAVFRKKNSSTVIVSSKPENIDRETFDLLTYIRLKPTINSNLCKLEFSDSKEFKKKNKKNQRLNTDQSNSSTENKEEPYVVVSKLQDHLKTPLGCKLNVGHIVKLGRVEYFVSEINFNGDRRLAQSKSKLTTCNRNVIKFAPDFHRKQINSCKICLDQNETKENFLFNPCRCSGSCGTVHIQCLQHWIQIKVKKETIGGTTHFNYEKFECEICKTQLPMIIDTNQHHIELLPIQKPRGNYLILEGACEKTKSVMLIQNPGNQGIKLGRGHQCQIRITDISVSRNHASIRLHHDGFYIFDNKSKFGTLIRDENAFDLEVGGVERGIQIGRTLVEVILKKKNSSQGLLMY